MRIFLCIVLVSFTSLGWSQSLQWEVFHPLKKQWMLMGTHGSVQEMLIQSGELPDPFWGDNEKKFGWIEDSSWKWRSTFQVDAELLQREFIYLNFPSVDTYAEIKLNGIPIAFCSNAFIPYSISCKNQLKVGQNTLELTFSPPIVYLKERFKKAPYTLPAPNDVHPIAVAPYVRKPQYQFGWDWALRMNTIGLLKPVTIDGFDKNSIRSTSVQTVQVTEASALLHLTVVFDQPLVDSMKMTSSLFGSCVLEPGKDTVVLIRKMENPQLWWPRGQGKQHVYTDKWEFESLTKQSPLKMSAPVRFGIRTAELVMDPDKWGTSYVIKVNGRPIFCKGADYIPQDIFPSKVSDERLKNMVDQMVESNFNMVRIWGGGYYPDDAFYAACDAAGIMVWQDFMFACAMYPGSQEFLNSVRQELRYQIPRISKHASVVLFNGNNEVDVAWKNWGFQIKYNLYGKDAKAIEDAYVKLFKQLIPDQVKALSTVPYVHTSPLSNWGKDEYYNHGSQHYWGVWHGKDPLADFGKKIGRFNAEYGFQSFPELSTIRTFADSTQWNLEDPVMKHHQKSYVGNGMIAKHADVLYGKSKNFKEFIYFSQLTQAEAVGLAVTGHRLDAPRCMGTLYWQLNDCWPAPTWSGIDYYGNWKALQYRMKKDFQDIAVLRKLDNGSSRFFLYSDVPGTSSINVGWTVHTLNGKKISEGNKIIELQSLASSELVIFTDQKIPADYVIEFHWSTSEGEVYSRTFSHVQSNRSAGKEPQLSVEIIEVDEVQKKAKIAITTDRFVRDVCLYSMKGGLHFADNFIDCLPGKHMLEVTFQNRSDLNGLELMYRK